jgi:hypothetical protein
MSVWDEKKVWSDQDIIDLHVKTFGVEPVVTGWTWDSGDFIDRVMDAIDKGEPYVEPEVPDDVDL